MTALAAVAFALLHVLAQVSVNVSAPSDVGRRDPILVQVEVTAPAGRDVQLTPPSFAPFRVVTTSTATSLDSTNNPRVATRAVWQTIDYRFVLAPPLGASGRYTFPPFEARVRAPGLRDAIARSAVWSITVHPPPGAASTLPAIVDRARVDPSKGINFHALAVPDTVYVGQQVTYQVGVFLDEAVRSRLRRNPEFLPPELRGLLAYELPAGRTSLRDRVIAGKQWDVHVFQRAVFPLQPGRTDVPPAQLSYSLPLSLGFFSREESYTARSEPATIVAVAPPADGRPNDWVGAVGVLRAASRVDTASGRVGDPMIVTLRVEGTANVKLLPRPPLTLSWGTAVPGEERVTVDSGTLLVRGAKEFDWIVTPRDAGDQVVPAIRYAYFDPYQRRYDVATGGELPVHIAPGTLAAAPDSDASHVLEIRRVDSGPVRAPVPSHAAFWLVVLLAPLPAAALLVARRPRRPRPVPPAAAVLRDVARAAPSVDVRAVRRAFGGALADRLALPDAGTALVSARPGVITRRLRRAGVTNETAEAVEALVHALNSAAYDSSIVATERHLADARTLVANAVTLYARVDAEARARPVLHALAGARRQRTGASRAIVLGAVAASAIATGVHALARQRAADAFAQGVAEYSARRFAAAQRSFETVAHDEVRSPDAWANLGTAAWAAGDTVGAAIGWQRSIRLEPRAADVRVRLDLLPASQDGWIAGVPPLPLDWAAITGLGLWIAACAIAAVRLAGRGRGWPLMPLGTASLVAASGSALLSVQLAHVAEARDLAVVRAAGVLRHEPALGAETTGTVEATDVARVLSRQSVWARVALDGGRQGWIEVDRLAPLAP